jgi:integration host factor subunit beta
LTKSELITQLTKKYKHLYHRDLEKIVDTIFGRISTALSNDDRVELRGFGTFSVKRREAHMGRNPRTGEEVKVESKAIPFFRMGKEMRKKLNS